MASALDLVLGLSSVEFAAVGDRGDHTLLRTAEGRGLRMLAAGEWAVGGAAGLAPKTPAAGDGAGEAAAAAAAAAAAVAPGDLAENDKVSKGASVITVVTSREKNSSMV